jgi:hypothetical protein
MCSKSVLFKEYRVKTRAASSMAAQPSDVVSVSTCSARLACNASSFSVRSRAAVSRSAVLVPLLLVRLVLVIGFLSDLGMAEKAVPKSR